MFNDFDGETRARGRPRCMGEVIIIVIIWNFKKVASGFRLDYSSSGCYK